MDSLILKVRDSLNDNLKSNKDEPDVFEYTTSKIFKLSEDNIDDTTLVVYKNGVILGSGTYDYDSDTGDLTIITTLAIGNIIQAKYSYYKYSDTEISGYIRAEFTYLSVFKYKDFVDRTGTYFPTPSTSEEYLIALIASIIVKPSIRSYKTADVTIVFNDKMSKEDKIKEAIFQFPK